MALPMEAYRGTAAGVPFVALPPATGGRAGAPAVVAWHLNTPPRTERALAAALPLAGLDAWRLYLGVPMCGSRPLPGGDEELLRRLVADAVLAVYEPMTACAAAEFPAAWADLRARFDLAAEPAALLGGSIGGSVAARVALDRAVPLDALVLISALIRPHPAITALARQAGTTYTWSPESRAAAGRLDLVARAGELAARGEPAVLLVVGERDLAEAFLAPAAELRAALAHRYRDPARVALATVPAMGHAFADDPGYEPAPQTPDAAAVDAIATDWLRRHLATARSDA